MKLLRNKRPFAVTITPQDAPDIDVDAGGTFEVDDALAGRAPKGDDPGEGLLAQVDNYEEVADKPAGRSAKKED